MTLAEDGDPIENPSQPWPEDRTRVTAGTFVLERAYADWARAEAQLAQARDAVEQAKTDQDLLIAHLAELSALDPVAGEEERLALARADMQKGEKLSGDLEDLRHLWEGSDSPLATLRIAARRLDRIAAEHPLLAEALAAFDIGISEDHREGIATQPRRRQIARARSRDALRTRARCVARAG